MENKLTPFEENLKQFFPDIFALHMLMKSTDQGGGGEVHLLTLIESLAEFNRTGETGAIYIHFSKGRIDGIDKKSDLLAFKKHRPGY